MADIKGKVEDVGQKISDAAKAAGHKIADGAEQAADWVGEKTGLGSNKEACGTAKSITDIREHMDVMGSCGNKLGTVDHVQGSSIKLTKSSSADGHHHLIPMSWVSRVDTHVHLNKNCGEAKKEWQPA
ncbi:DUF2171 domain-containing protein [Fimbriiglobus ruber]|uniref:Uncharacterized protein n=1 Tax=Fimbriiglobus ruber TaxID=1908690 RepID=A0A225DTS6_9BACT|nr:DUF2171 domain-containing protein [Fimbriiglobus ruber]OWK40589.1 hypothetical protein FRUB_05508 [Fimbriiglobus ruber]